MSCGPPNETRHKGEALETNARTKDLPHARIKNTEKDWENVSAASYYLFISE